MKINQILWSVVLCVCWMLLGCAKKDKQPESKANATTETTTTNSAENSSATKITKSTPKDKPNLFMEFTITGGELDGQTFRGKVRYSASDQATYEKGQDTEMEFTRALVEGTQLQIGLVCTWKDGFAKGKRNVVQPGGQIVIYNVGKDPKYKFEKLYINFKEFTMEMTEVGEWKPSASNKKLIYAGEGKVTTATAEAFTSQFDKRPASVSAVAFKYRARAIQY